MTREEAIARIKDHMSVHKIYEERAVKITEALNMAISALQQPEQQWIPCSERLLGDDEYAEVLCCDTHKNYIIGYPFADPASETGYSAESDGVYMYDCIAWMRCPEPYRAERSEG